MEHPFVALFHEEVRIIIDRFDTERAAQQRRWGRSNSLVVILRGMPGCGKSTFATMMKLYAECHGLQAQICSADDFFIGRDGYLFDPARIAEVHRLARALCESSLRRQVPVVIIDNTNVNVNEWGAYETLAGNGQHFLTKVNFRCNFDEGQDSMEYAHQLRMRSWHAVPHYTIQRRFQEFTRHNYMFRPDMTIFPMGIVRDVPRDQPAQDQPAQDQGPHPMQLVFFDEVETIVEEYMQVRAEHDAACQEDPTNRQHHARASQTLVVILRGLPGCGKSTFALQTKLYAEARGLRSQIFSTDHFFEDETGFHFSERDLEYARGDCYRRVESAIRQQDQYRRLAVVIVDDQHISFNDWMQYVRLARGHRIEIVNFRCDLFDLARLQASRSFHAREYRYLDHEAWLYRLLREYNDERALLPWAEINSFYTIEPRINDWFDAEWNRATQP